MLKKFGLVAVGVTAGLVAVAPLASAQDHGSDGGDCSSQSDDQGNSGQLNTCNVFGQRVGEGNTFNGMPIGPSAPIQDVPVG